MADFKTHFSAAVYVSGFFAALIMSSGKGAPPEVVLFFFLGIAGGFLPDIDSDYSRSSRYTFSLLGIILSFIVIIYFGKKFSISELVILWITVNVFIRCLFFFLLSRYTVHRGLMHSVPAGVFVSMIFVTLSFHVAGVSSSVSWAGGLFLFAGFMMHLVLDEIYSFNFFSIPVKKSFGSAMKLFSLKNKAGTLLLYLLIFVLSWMMPPFEEFKNNFASADAISYMKRNFFPENGWFRHKSGN